MHTDPVAVLIKFGFLAVLYLFLLWVARSSLKDLRRGEEPAVAEGPGRREVGVVSERNGDGGPDGADGRPGGDPRLEVVAAKAQAPGTAFSLADGATLGRAHGADVHVDDPFASSAHARIYRRGPLMYIEDMGSTNGTYLNGRQLRRPERLNAADVVRIGDTEFRYRE